MRVALVGYSGYWGQKLGRVLLELGHDIVSEIDRTNISQLSDSDADVAIIATPPDTHYDLSMRAMKLGMDVLVEKPMAMRYSQAQEMAEFAKANGIVLSVDSTFCHSASFEFLMSLNEPLISYQSIRMAPAMPQAVITSGWDLVVHDISILHGLKAMSGAAGIGVEDGAVASAAFNLTSGGSAFIMASRCWPTKIREIALHFPSGTYHWTLSGLSKGDKTVAVEEEEPLKRLIKNLEFRCQERMLEGITDGLHGSTVVRDLERLFPHHSSIGINTSRVGNGLLGTDAGKYLPMQDRQWNKDRTIC